MGPWGKVQGLPLQAPTPVDTLTPGGGDMYVCIPVLVHVYEST